MNNADQAGPLKTRLLNWLLDRYGGKNDIPEKGGARALSKACKQLNINISPGTFQNILSGTEADLAVDTKKKLVELFSRAVPAMQSKWFDSAFLGEKPFETFQALCIEGENIEKGVTINPPRLSQQRIDKYKRWLSGLYICYRYSFEVNADDSVAREILRVWYSPDESGFKFELWYVAGNLKPGEVVESFKGPVVLIGDMIMFVGVSENRARSIFWTYDPEDQVQGHFKYCRLGITSGVKARDDKAPVAACTVCVKMENPDEDWKWWCSSRSHVIGVDSFDSIIGADFGNEILKTITPQLAYAEWIRLFIENKPMDETQTGHGSEDRILRLNLRRFRLRMEPMRKSIITNKGCAPFNAEIWKKAISQVKPETVS